MIIFGLGLFCVYEIVFFVPWSPELWFWVINTKEQGPIIILTGLFCLFFILQNIYKLLNYVIGGK
jgi:hypothetical protein